MIEHEKPIQGESRIIGMKFWDAKGNAHFAPCKEYKDQYLDDYIDSQKMFRPVNKITKQLIADIGKD